MKKISNDATILLLGTLFTRTAMFMSIPFLAIYLDNVMGLSAAQIGYVIGVNPLVNVFFSLFIRKIIDFFDLKKALFITPIVWGIIFILFAFTNLFIGFLILNGLNGLCYVIYEPSCKMALSQYTDSKTKLFVFNLRYTAINIGAVVGPVLSIPLGFKYSIKPYIILGCMYVVVGCINYFLKEPQVISDHNFDDSVKYDKEKIKFDKKVYFNLFLLITGVAFSHFGYSLFNSTIAQYLSRLGSNGVEL